MSFSQGIYDAVWEEFVFKIEIPLWETVLMQIFRVAVWFTKGLHPPEVISDVSSGLDISPGYLLGDWLPPIFIFSLIGYFLGSWMMTRKELDKVQT